MNQKYKGIITLILIVIFVGVSMRYFHEPYVKEFFYTTLWCSGISVFFYRLFQRSDLNKKIIRTKHYQWKPFLIWEIIAVLYYFFSDFSQIDLVYGSMEQDAAMAISFALVGVALLPRNIVFNESKIQWEDWFNSSLAYTDGFSIDFEENKILINYAEKKFVFEIRTISQKEREEILAWVKEKKETCLK